MDIKKLELPNTGLPVRYELRLVYLFSLIVTFLMFVASCAGLLYTENIYPTEELRQSFMANDVVNLVIGVPILLGSMLATRRGRLVGLLFWPGAMLYVSYNYIAYLFSAPVTLVFPLYPVLVTLSVYTTIGLVAGIEGSVVKEQLSGAVPERLAGGVLAGLGILMLLRGFGVLIGALYNQATIPEVEKVVLITDFIMTPAWIYAGVDLWRRRQLGYVAGVGLLFQTSMLFIGLIIFLLLQPLLSGVPFAPIDILVVFIMGLICIIPFGLFFRAAASVHN